MSFLLNIFFYPFTFIWSKAYSYRRYLYLSGLIKSDFFLLPVISVGNIVMGGSGKTPFVAWLTEVFQENNLNVCILTRGYRSVLEKSFGVLQANSKNKDPKLYGDEPVLLSTRLKNDSLVVVGRNRRLNLKKIYNKFKPDIVLLDDGFQHLKIKRDINIVLFDATIPISKLKTPPLGYLRESLPSLRDADIVVLNKVSAMNDSDVALLENLISDHIRSDVEIFKTTYEVNGIFNNKREKVGEAKDLKGRNILTFSGIANPDNFNHNLLSLGANIEHTLNFSDHYSYNEEDITEILKIAEEKELEIFTTEKDIVKLSAFKGTESINYLSVDIKFIEGKERFLTKINDKIVFDYYNTKKDKLKIN
jgi:tetraacyldisaccharide 4'-kinase